MEKRKEEEEERKTTRKCGEPKKGKKETQGMTHIYHTHTLLNNGIYKEIATTTSTTITTQESLPFYF